MTTSFDIECRDALLALLQAREWLTETQFESTWLPRTFVGDGSRHELEKLLISVVAAGETSEPAARGRDLTILTVDVGFRRYVGREEETQGDSLVHLIATVSRELRNWSTTLSNGCEAQVMTRETIVIADPQILEEKGIMSSVLRLTLHTYEPIS